MKSLISIFNTLPLLVSMLVIAGCRPDHDRVTPQIKPLMEAVYASGFVVADDEYEVYSQAEGYLAEKLANDGQEVSIGDPLFIIEGDQQSARHRLAKENFEMASTNYRDNSPVMEEVVAAMATAQSRMKFDSLNYVRYQNLLDRNATTRAEFDRMKLLYENSVNEYELQQSRREKVKNQLYIDLQNAKSLFQIARDETGRSTIRSQVNGKVFRTMKERGELVRRNEAVAVIGRDSAFYLQLTVDELDIQRVQIGQKVLVKIDAYAGKVYEAHVSKIYSMINKQQQSIRVDAVLNENLPGSFSGLALEANIIIREKPDALVIPKAALLPGDSVHVETADGRVIRKVERGIETLDEVEITSGLDSIEVILVSAKN
jgi:multidrug efflux pump subunit AcrA (membrane-fusion protein)